jgi:cyclophilin family peptidyl-prolyl cis-trans isomerase
MSFAPRTRSPLSRVFAGVAAATLLAWSGAATAQTTASTAADGPVRVRIDTNLGSFIVELDTERAPLTSANFLQYARSGFYTGTVFHRVIDNFVAQAGGYDAKYEPKTPQAPIPNESGNGLSNQRGTLGLARTEAPHSGNAQFYVNLANNEALDPSPLRWGYAVFGRVVEGLDVIDRIGHVPTGAAGPFPKDAPLDPVEIRGMEVIGDPTTAAPPGAAALPAAADAAATNPGAKGGT